MDAQSSLSQARLRLFACHEAAHAAARAFAKLEFSHFLEVSIVPDEDSVGRELYERPYAWMHQKTYSPCMARCEGYKLLLGKMAGLACEEMLDPEGEIIVFGLHDELPSLDLTSRFPDGATI